MDALKFHDIVELLKKYSPEDIIKAKNSTLGLIENLYDQRLLVSDEIKRTLLHYKTADKPRARELEHIERHLIPENRKKVQDQLESFYQAGKTSSVRQMKRKIRERDYLLRSKKEHDLRVKQRARSMVLIYADIKRAEEQYDLLIKSDHVKRFLLENGITPGVMTPLDIERWGREYTRNGGVNNV